MTDWHRTRRALGVVGTACGALFAPIHVQAQVPLPQRNLLVEWRLGSGSQQQIQGVGLRGGEVTVDSRGGMTGRAGVTVTSTTRSHSEISSQQIQVLNGGQARLYLGSSRPVTQWQFGVAGAGGGVNLVSAGNGAGGQGAGTRSGPGWQAWSSTTWVDTGRGITVRPRWGGGQTVNVELEARVAQQAAYAPDGQIESAEVMTTVQLPLGAWTAVARRGGGVQQRQRGVLSTEDVSRDDNEVLEMRVSAP